MQRSLRPHLEATHLAVWALFRIRPKNSFDHGLFYEAPGGTNPNLNAQQGLFSLIVDENQLSLEEHLFQNKQLPSENRPLLQRLMLPTSMSTRLLRLLAEEGITGATMFPGADGVVRAMREEALWKGSETQK